MGAGAYHHYIPAAVDALLEEANFFPRIPLISRKFPKEHSAQSLITKA